LSVSWFGRNPSRGGLASWTGQLLASIIRWQQPAVFDHHPAEEGLTIPLAAPGHTAAGVPVAITLEPSGEWADPDPPMAETTPLLSPRHTSPGPKLPNRPADVNCLLKILQGEPCQHRSAKADCLPKTLKGEPCQSH
jgi:hypothetical protein